MRLPLLLILPILLLDALIDWYICRAVWRRCTHHVKEWGGTAKESGSDGDLTRLMWCLYAYFSVYIAKYFFVIFDLTAKIPQLFGRQRIKALSWVGIIMACIAFGMMWWGALINRWRTDIREVEFVDTGVPRAFDGFKIVQLSDIHTGSYGSDTTYLAGVVGQATALTPTWCYLRAIS